MCNCSVVSGSRDSTLRMWDIKTGQCVHVLVGHVAAVRCVQYDGHRVRTMYTTSMSTQDSKSPQLNLICSPILSPAYNLHLTSY